MKIAVTRQDYLSDFIPSNEQPWKNFFDRLLTEGHDLVLLDDNPDLIIFMNHHKKPWSRCLMANHNVLKVLVLWESRVTRPRNFDQDSLDGYDLIFTPSVHWLSGKNVFPFNWPQGRQLLKSSNEKSFNSRDDRAVVFQNNKFSFVDGEMYSLRREIIKVLDEKLVVFGKGWKSSASTFWSLLGATKQSLGLHREFKSINLSNLFIKPKNYGGFAVYKNQELEKFKFTIVVENSLDYVSEKLFEALWAGCCVLYVGPPLKDFGIPKVALECPPNADQIKSCYEIAKKDNVLVEETLDLAKRFVLSSMFEEKNSNRVLDKLAFDILEQIGFMKGNSQ